MTARAGSIFYIAWPRNADVHNRDDPLPADELEQAQRKKEALRAGRETVASPHPRSHPQEAPDVLARARRDVAVDYFRRLGTTIQRVSPKLYAWEEKKEQKPHGR